MAEQKSDPKPFPTLSSKGTGEQQVYQPQGKGFLFPFVGAIGKWQRTLTEERRQKIKKLFTVPRNDPEDPFKPNSEIQVKVISEQPLKEPLSAEDEKMLQAIAVNYDYCLPLDIINWPHPIRGDISTESREQLEKLPTWLKALILLRYDKIQEFFGHRTHLFLRMLANRVDFQRSIPMKIFEMDDNDDEEDYYIINKNFLLTEDDITAQLQEKRGQKSIHGQDLFRVAHAIVLWRLPKSARAEWAPNVVHRSACILRRAMLTQASPAEIAMAAEDEKIDVLSDDSDEDDLNKPPSWKEIISEKPEFTERIQQDVEKDFETIPVHFRKLGEEVAPRVKKKRAMMKKKAELKRQQLEESRSGVKWWKRNKLFEKRKARRDKKDELITRGLYRRYSRIWYKNCPMEEIAPTKKRAHHSRRDEGFHAYIVALVASRLFKTFIMGIIIFNAIILAVETGDLSDSYVDLFEILDNLFLSVYLAVYAHPQRFWRSGFNIFDFIILVASFIKAISDWFSLADISLLRVLVIVRALRILRGVSLFVQIQVLVTAMVETLKTHVLSVLILLLLIMYIVAIMAFYIFGEDVPDEWGNIGKGMLNLFAFVTMDGWTEMIESFTEKGYTHIGRLFCLVGIVLGNFVFANIFIAIIIMQISEATDAFRMKQRDEREAIVKKKKETVFRRQKLDMRQLLARQKMSFSVDFYYLANQFQRLLRHDDLVDMNEMVCSPMWIDCINRSSQRCLHTSNMLMNLHRQIADHLLEVYHLYNDPKPSLRPIRRARYNRCVRLKAKLTALRNDFYNNSGDRVSADGELTGPHPLKVKLPSPDPSELLAAEAARKNMPKKPVSTNPWKEKAFQFAKKKH